ncbi:hypothetical protein KXR56_00310 [Bacillus inaquosorum]|uniref:hypothetical protein n=1 Tax=Bacillus inaquosorum TaxID=483913 RepID=UPI003F148A96
MLSVEARNKIRLLMKLTQVIFAVAVLTSVLSFSTFDVGTNNELIKITLDRVAALKKSFKRSSLNERRIFLMLTNSKQAEKCKKLLKSQ